MCNCKEAQRWPFTRNIRRYYIHMHACIARTYMPPFTGQVCVCVMHVLLSADLRLCLTGDGVVSVMCSDVECRSICGVYLALLQRAVMCFIE